LKKKVANCSWYTPYCKTVVVPQAECETTKTNFEKDLYGSSSTLHPEFFKKWYNAGKKIIVMELVGFISLQWDTCLTKTQLSL
jgi:hypothetical protein